MKWHRPYIINWLRVKIGCSILEATASMGFKEEQKKRGEAGGNLWIVLAFMRILNF